MSNNDHPSGGNIAVLAGTLFVLLGLLQSLVVGQHIHRIDEVRPILIGAPAPSASKSVQKPSRQQGSYAVSAAFDERALIQRIMSESECFQISSQLLEEVLSYHPSTPTT